ncbi:hypothetical protein MSAN_02135000 [Mycena sanguinolenta]|uniref:Uncharacterized protein n=1 Tax=Mycena sanguinolenta TaxID=230812 RepID=A0A8H7CLN0_9AGAR|nr:hypothetical protein MSAN_02135000 [Mycena sanguinolenta]
MDDHSQPEPEFAHSSTCEPESPSHASGMFSHSRNFAVRGRNLTNITNNYAAPSLPSDFRMIPMGDIDLRHEIRVDNSTGVLNYHRQRAHVRRLYSAKVEGRKSTLTVAMYQGHGAEEKWRQDIAKYMSMRHPSIVQICGAASSNGIHATLFNDGTSVSVQSIPMNLTFGIDLIPLEEVLDGYRHSPVWTVYIYAFCNRDFSEVYNYLNSEFQLQRYSEQCTNWIRHSTGRLCTELTEPSGQGWCNSLELVPHHLPRICITASHIESFDIVDWLTLEQYHHKCIWNLRQHRSITLQAATVINLGAVIHCSSNPLEDSVEIALFPSVVAPILYGWTISGEGTGEVMPNSWTRFQSGDVINSALYLSSSIYPYRATWLSQANHVFRCLNIMSNFEDYVVVEDMQTTEDSLAGFLFLCPKEDFRIGSSSLCWPACTAYWSLDPSGIVRLSLEEATALGFPSFELATKVEGCSWDASVYEGLRQFHKAKGFDPYSQHVARHLGYTLYQLSSQRDTLRAYDSDGQDFDGDIDSGGRSTYAEEYASEYSPTPACDDSDLDVDADSSLIQEPLHDPVCGNSALTAPLLPAALARAPQPLELPVAFVVPVPVALAAMPEPAREVGAAPEVPTVRRVGDQHR